MTDRPEQHRAVVTREADVTQLLDCPWRLVVWDMDGTLVRGTTALAHLGAWIGHEAVIEGLEAKLARREVSDGEVAEGYARFYRGVALADAVEAMSGIASIEDIGVGVEMLRQRSVEVFIATVSWSFAARGLANLWGFSEVCGADLELDRSSGVFTGRVARHFAPEDKVAFVAEYCDRAGIAMEQVVAVGDSRSDLPLFKAVGFSVALNATRDAPAAASTSVEGPSFLTALRAVPRLLP
ncbi:MAG: HAD-IB family phosphatase [Actinomycetota bacterium]|nr:HAD-IB family phosphatase [Actinomycetota bacterium]